MSKKKRASKVRVRKPYFDRHSGKLIKPTILKSGSKFKYWDNEKGKYIQRSKPKTPTLVYDTTKGGRVRYFPSTGKTINYYFDFDKLSKDVEHGHWKDTLLDVHEFKKSNGYGGTTLAETDGMIYKTFNRDKAREEIKALIEDKVKIVSKNCHLIIVGQITIEENKREIEVFEWRSSVRETIPNIIKMQLDAVLSEFEEDLFVKYDYLDEEVKRVKIPEFQIIQIK